MKKTFVLLFVLVYSVNALFAGDEKNIVSAALQSVTVYRSGAELVHLAKASLKEGNNELVIDGISNAIDINSVQIHCDDKITIMSIAFSTDWLKPAVKPAIVRRLEDSVEVLNKELSKLDVVLATDKELLDLLKANKEIRGAQSGLSVAELMKMMDYYKSKVLDLQNEMAQYRDKKEKLEETIAKINLQIKEEEQKNTKTVGKLLLQLLSPLPGAYNFTISYITRNAYWNPTYDLRVDNINKPVRLMYKAKVVQTTGIDWKQVKLALATSTPNQNGNAPVLNSWFLSYIDPVTKMESSFYRSGVQALNSIQALSGRVPGLQVTAGDANVLAKEDKSVVTFKDNLGDYTTVSDNQMDVTFNIDIPYDLPGNGKEQSVSLKEYPLNTVFKYYAVPKLDKDAYLLGEVPDWEALNLLPGEANIIFEGTYIGKSYIDPNSTQDTMNLTLGKDKRIVIKKEKLKDFSSVKFLGGNKKQVVTYEITVKNNKKEAIQMLLKDQYPLSTSKEIEVELLESSDATNNTELGVLTWKLQLAPGAQKKCRISYSVKYPKDKLVNLGL